MLNFKLALAELSLMDRMFIFLSMMVTIAGEFLRAVCIWTRSSFEKIAPKSDAYGMSSLSTSSPTLSSSRSLNVLVVMAPPSLPAPAFFSKHSISDSVFLVMTLLSENHQR